MTARSLPAWYSWVVVVMLPIMASVAVLVVSLRVNERSIERERAARLASEQQAAESRAGLCQIYRILNGAYRQSPPTTDAGKAIAAAVAREISRC